MGILYIIAKINWGILYIILENKSGIMYIFRLSVYNYVYLHYERVVRNLNKMHCINSVACHLLWMHWLQYVRIASKLITWAKERNE